MAYASSTPEAGIVDLSTVLTAGQAGVPWSSPSGALPAFTPEQQLGQIVTAWDTSSTTNNATGQGGFGEFIFLSVPTSTTVTAGLLYSYNPSTYGVVLVPTAITTQALSGFPICVAVNAVTSNASSVQYTWFQCGGRCTALKTAVQVVGSIPIYVSGATAGRVKVLGSAFRGIIGGRTANTGTITSTTSTVAIYLNGRPCITAGI